MVKVAIQYLRGVVEEFKKVTFPSRPMVAKETLLVILSVIFGVIFLATVDYLLSQIVRSII